MGFLSNAWNWITGSALPWIGDNILGLGQTAAQTAAQIQTNNVNENIARENLKYQGQANLQNIALTREQNRLNRDLTERINNQNIAFQQNENAITRAREDNAVQRRAIDLQNAGLSKTLAAGSPASATPMTAPQAQGMHYDRATVQALNNQRKYESALMKLNIADTLTNVKLKVSEANKNNAQADTLGSQGKYLDSMAAMYASVGDKAGKRVDAQISLALQQIAESKSRMAVNNQTIYKMSFEISKIIAETNNLNKEQELLVAQIVMQRLNALTGSWNLAKNMQYGTPTNYQPSALGALMRDTSGVLNSAIFGNDYYGFNLDEIMKDL